MSIDGWLQMWKIIFWVCGCWGRRCTPNRWYFFSLEFLFHRWEFSLHSSSWGSDSWRLSQVWKINFCFVPQVLLPSSQQYSFLSFRSTLSFLPQITHCYACSLFSLRFCACAIRVPFDKLQTPLLIFFPWDAFVTKFFFFYFLTLSHTWSKSAHSY